MAGKDDGRGAAAPRPRAEREAERALKRAAGTPRTTRLRRLECEHGCGYPPVRVSRAAIVAGLPACPCGAVLWPSDVDDALLAVEHGHLTDAQLAYHPEWLELRTAEEAVIHGQAPRVKGGRVHSGQVSDPNLVAYGRLVASREARNREARLAALRAHNPFAAPAVEEPIPF